MVCRTIKTLKNISLIVLLMAGFSSCYYDNEEYLYPAGTGLLGCDTANVTYSGTIEPIMQDHCNSCHSEASPSGGVVTETYQGLKIVADDGRLYGAVNHIGGYAPMPQNQPKLSECKLTQIDIWLNAGAPNN